MKKFDMNKDVNATKITYAQPNLAVYGRFSQLTAAGSQGSTEGSGGGGGGGPDQLV